jgi:hypothetical protein
VHGDVHALLNTGILQKTEDGRIVFPFARSARELHAEGGLIACAMAFAKCERENLTLALHDREATSAGASAMRLIAGRTSNRYSDNIEDTQF